MIVGVSALRLGRPAEARPALAYARSQNPTSWFLQLAYGEAALGCGDDRACAAALERAETLEADAVAMEELRAALRSVRRELPVTNALASLAGGEATTPAQWETALRVLLDLGMANEAVALHARRPQRVSEASGHLLAAEVATAARDVAAAIAAWSAVLAHDPGVAEQAFEALLDLDASEEAEAVARQAQQAGNPLLLGRFALYGGRLDDAQALFCLAEPSQGQQAALAAVALCRGEVRNALGILSSLTRGPSEELMHIEATRRAGRITEARDAFDALSPRTLRQVAATPLCRVALFADAALFGPETRDLLPPLQAQFDDLAGIADATTFAAAAIGALSGNWSPRATRTGASGTPRQQPIARGIREQVADLHRGLAALPFSMLIERLGQLERQHGAHPLIATYGAELLLWFGDYEQADGWLKRALELDERTRWAHIGMAILHNVEGRPEGALAAIARQRALLTPLANSLVCTAEAHLRLGDMPRALADYEAAIDHHPTRVSAWLGLAAARIRAGQPHAAQLEHVRRLTPTFFAQWEREAAGLPEVDRVDHALLMLRGNRGSGLITWRTRDGAFHGENARADATR